MAPLLDDLDTLSADLRTVIALTTGVRAPEDRCRRLLLAMEAPDAPPRHLQAAAYLLAAHHLALRDRPSLDGLAYRWVGRRLALPPRAAADALRLAVFAAESAWPAHLVRRLMGVIAWSRGGPLWISLTDLARSGGRNADRLRSLLEHADLLDPTQPAHRAAAALLSHAHDLHRHHAEVGPGWAILADTAPDRRVLTLYVRGSEVPGAAQKAASALYRRLDLRHAVVSHDAGCAHLDLGGQGRVVPIRAWPDVDDVMGPVSPIAANCPPALGIRLDDVLNVFPAGPAVAREGRSWIGEVLRAARDAEAGCRSG